MITSGRNLRITQTTSLNILSWSQNRKASSGLLLYPKSTIYKPIVCRIKWQPVTGTNPGLLKQFIECTLLFRQPTSNQMKIGFETNFSPNYTSNSLSTFDSGQWGGFDFGTIPWSGFDHTYVQALRVGIPASKQRCAWIQPSVEANAAFNSFSCAGISIILEGMSERFNNKG